MVLMVLFCVFEFYNSGNWTIEYVLFCNFFIYFYYFLFNNKSRGSFRVSIYKSKSIFYL